ncbi:DUF3298 domain-containing protein [Dokdonia sinensis]|uniref:DUF3298 domain-containing protein n=1 Tax=Dokdonia sinensis TaxID=2479847 RepID=A0A3M0G4W0_9FLAO|nr:DUF3298 and DUF4163 domain-containing protein [Dokdonia sinensis]RMB59087.1 DUF3298 domain-containing protein [Dokdonia sinensis]
MINTPCYSMRISIVTLILFFFFSSCKEAVIYDFKPITIQTEDFKECVDEQCPTLFLDYFELTSPKSLTETVNLTIKKQFISQLVIDGQQSETIQQAAEVYLNNSQTAYPEDSIMSAQHELEMILTPTYTSDEVLSIQTNFYQFSGGAHGYGGVLFQNFNVKTGAEMTIPELFKDVEAFTAFAKAEFRTQQEIPDGASINSTGFMFEDDVFALPENIGFTDEGMVLYYNSYEVSAYADGAQEIIIPWETAEAYLSF